MCLTNNCNKTYIQDLHVVDNGCNYIFVYFIGQSFLLQFQIMNMV